MLSLVTTWFLNMKLEPQEIQVTSPNGMIETYMYHDKWNYGCPSYCGIDHVHFINDSTYNSMLKNNRIIEKK